MQDTTDTTDTTDYSKQLQHPNSNSIIITKVGQYRDANERNRAIEIATKRVEIAKANMDAAFEALLG